MEVEIALVFTYRVESVGFKPAIARRHLWHCQFSVHTLQRERVYGGCVRHLHVFLTSHVVLGSEWRSQKRNVKR